MVRQNRANERLPWADRFKTPELKDLELGLSSSERALFRHAGTYLSQLSHSTGEIVWMGDCWKWTTQFEYRRTGRPLAVVIPNPDDLQIATTAADDFIQQIWPKRMRRAVRDGLEMAAPPFDSEWCTWSVTTRTILDEVLDLIRAKYQFRLASQ